MEPARRPPDAATPRVRAFRARHGGGGEAAALAGKHAATPSEFPAAARAIAFADRNACRQPVRLVAFVRWRARPGPSVTASIDRGYASSTAFASSGGNGRPPLLLLLVPGRLAGSAVASASPFDLARTYRMRPDAWHYAGECMIAPFLNSSIGALHRHGAMEDLPSSDPWVFFLTDRSARSSSLQMTTDLIPGRCCRVALARQSHASRCSCLVRSLPALTQQRSNVGLVI